MRPESQLEATCLFTVVPKQPFNLTPSPAATLSNTNGPNPTNAVAAIGWAWNLLGSARQFLRPGR